MTERRYFIRDGQVTEHYPYWPAMAITENNPDHVNWQELLAELNDEPKSEIEELTKQAQIIASTLPGYWSVDFAQHVDGRWFLIDMALGERSWKPSAEDFTAKPDTAKLLADETQEGDTRE